MKHRLLLAFSLIAASLASSQSLAEEKPLDDCGEDDMAVFLAERYSAAWIDPLTEAFVTIESGNINAYSDIAASSEDIDRLRSAYRKIVKKYYSAETWLPGVRNFVNENFTLSEQCQLLAFYKTEIGGKSLRLQITPGASEFIRQQATNFRREQKGFSAEREAVLKGIFPSLADGYFSSGRPF